MFNRNAFFVLKSELTRQRVETGISPEPPTVEQLSQLMPSEWHHGFHQMFAQSLVTVYLKPEPYFSDCVEELQRTYWKVREKVTIEDGNAFDRYCKAIENKYEPQRAMGKLVGSLRGRVRGLRRRIKTLHAQPVWFPVMVKHTYVSPEPDDEGRFVWLGPKTQIEALYRELQGYHGMLDEPKKRRPKTQTLKAFSKLFVCTDGKSPNYSTLKTHPATLPPAIVHDLNTVLSAEQPQKSNI